MVLSPCLLAAVSSPALTSVLPASVSVPAIKNRFLIRAPCTAPDNRPHRWQAAARPLRASAHRRPAGGAVAAGCLAPGNGDGSHCAPPAPSVHASAAATAGSAVPGTLLPAVPVSAPGCVPTGASE